MPKRSSKSPHDLTAESIVAAGEDRLIHLLDYKINANTASYVVDRQECKLFPSGNLFSSAGVRSLRSQISGAGFLDPNLWIQMKVNNQDSSNVMTPLTPGAHSLQ